MKSYNSRFGNSESFSIKCEHCGKTFLYFHLLTDNENFENFPCCFCDSISFVYARVDSLDPFVIQHILVENKL